MVKCDMRNRERDVFEAYTLFVWYRGYTSSLATNLLGSGRLGGVRCPFLSKNGQPICMSGILVVT